jgi:two-component system sensor histidine kinase VanS
VTVALFSQQFLTFYNTSQIEQLVFSYQSLHEQLQGKSVEDIKAIAKEYYENNQSFSFFIRDSENNIIFSSPNLSLDDLQDDNTATVKMTVGQNIILTATNQSAIQTEYSGLISKLFFALSFMLLLSVVGAFIFARQITKPIKRLAANTKKMANLEDVASVQGRRDELGDLTHDVHAMYDKLKDEIIRRREMEETQRYFFSAASHELKTPIAATGILLEGMLENIGDYKDHPKYLRECLKLMDTQNNMISEILEIVNLSDGKIIPNPEKVDVWSIISELLPSFNTLAEANNQRISVNIPKGQFCLVDSKMLKRALSNIILNAIQNTPNGYEVRIWSESSADICRINVLNTGTNIDKAVLSKLFDPFYRADKARSRKNRHSGLGLKIEQKTLVLMEIEFSLINTDDGVLFWLDLPEI